MAAIAGKEGAVYISSAASSAFTNEACTDSGDDTTFYITDRTKRFWDDATTPTVEYDVGGGGSWAAAPAHTIDYATGTITFDSALGASDLVRVSGDYFTVTNVADAFSWELEIDTDMLDDTRFGDEHRRFTPGNKGGSGSVSVRFLPTVPLLDKVGDRIILELATDSGNVKAYAMYALLSKEAAKTEITALVEHSFDFTVDGKVGYDSY